MSRDVSLVIEELVLDGIEPGDAFVHASLIGALVPHLAEHGLEATAGRLATSVSAALAGETSELIANGADDVA